MRRLDLGPLESVNHTGAALRQLLLPAGPRGAISDPSNVRFDPNRIDTSVDTRESW